jgi:hypothetical protein
MFGIELNDRFEGHARDGQWSAMPAPPEAGAGLWVAVLPPAEVAQLGRALGELRNAGHGVQGFVDRAALLAAALGGDAQWVVLEAARGQFSISLAGNAGGEAALRRQLRLAGGMAALQRAWLDLAASTLVQQTRFDPLHDQQHEAGLRARLPQLAAAAQRDGQASCDIEAGDSLLQLTLTRDQFATAAAPIWQPLAAALQAFAASGEDSVLLVPEILLDVPGFDTVLAQARFARQFRHADGLAARAASLLPATAAAEGGAVTYRSSLPAFGTPLRADLAPVEASGMDVQRFATHVVYRGGAIAIPTEGLVIGRDPGTGLVLRLPEGVAGLSRRHCTLYSDGARSQLVDHSSHGSFIDGARVHGRALLAAGSTLRLGDPGIELPLVALGAAG